MSLRPPRDAKQASVTPTSALDTAKTLAAHGIGVLILVAFAGAYWSWASAAAEKKRVQTAEIGAIAIQAAGFP